MRKLKFKRLTAALLVASMTLGLAACGKEKEEDTEKSTKKEIVTEASTDEPEVPAADSDLDRTFVDTEFAETENAEFKKYLDDYFKDSVTADTMSYNYSVKNGDDFGITAPVATIGDATMNEKVYEDAKADSEDRLKKLHEFDISTLTKKQYVDYLWLEDKFQSDIDSYVNMYFYEPFSYMRGFQGNIGTSFSEYRFDDKTDVEDYIAMMGQIPTYVQQSLDYEKEKAKAGYMMSDKNIDQVIQQCDDFLGTEGDDHFLITCFNEKIDALSFLSDAEKADYKAKDMEAVKKNMFPAFHNIKDTFTSLKGTATVEGGLCQYGDEGKEYYEVLLREYTGSSKGAEGIIADLDDRLEKGISALSVVATIKPDAYKYFGDNYSELFKAEDGKESKEIIDELMTKYMGEFPEVGTIPYEVDYLPKSLESVMSNTLAYYMSPAIDDQSHNIIRVNGANTSGIFETLAHEGCPGHMYQNYYFMQTDPHPARCISNELGYMEGWAVYTSYEVLYNYDFGGSEYAKELGKLTVIDNSLGYLIYGRIDLGVNYEGWTVDDVKSYLENSGFGTDGAEEIYTTVVGDPAVYLSYSQGYYEMLEQREKAEEKLGDKFDPVAFHKAVLEVGPCKYDLLTKLVDAYIIENK